MRSAARLLLAAALPALAACGKKGAPLAPLHLVPSAPASVEIRRTGDEARLRLVLPAGNANGPGPATLDRVVVYAATVAPGTPPPANRDLLTEKFAVGTIAVRPAPVEGEPEPAGAPGDTRPSAGETVTFVEPLTPAALEPAPAPAGRGADAATARRAAGASLVTTALGTVTAGTGPSALAAAAVMPAAGPAAFAATFATAASAAVAAAIPKHNVRVYAVRGMTKAGRPGEPSPRVELPIVAAPPPPAAPLAAATETAVTVTWVAPAAPAPAAGAPFAFNVYRPDAAVPLHEAPLAAPPFERPGATWGTEECFVVRTVVRAGAAWIESPPSGPACVTPRDVFPPAAPKAVSLVAGPGLISLSWDAGTEADLGGYLVLRAEVPGGTLQPLTPAPIAATNFEDRTVKPGVRYAYTVVAVDRASPPNRSAPSARVEETAR